MKKSDQYKVGERIKHFRKNANLSQDDLAELTGLTRNHISNLETGTFSPSIDAIVEIANALQISANDLLSDIIFNKNDNSSAEISRILIGCTPKEQSFLIESLLATKHILSKYILK